MKTISNRKAVAPIIATLLMVAIAVVGGILIFVFTQGFFADEQVVGPTVDNIRIFGYDTTDGTTAIDGYDDIAIVCDEGVAGSTLATGDCLTIFVENLGDKPVAFQAVRIFGETYTSGSQSSNNCAETSGEFNLMITGGTEISVLEPNTQATLCMEYIGSNPVKAGRTIPIQVETSNGQSSQINIINGADRGKQCTGVKAC